MPWLMRPFWPLFRLLTRDDGGRSAEKASRSSIRLASDPALEGVTGNYFDLKAKSVAWPSALDAPGVSEQLWAEATRLAGLAGAAW